MVNAAGACPNRPQSFVSRAFCVLLSSVLALALVSVAVHAITVSVSEFELSGSPASEVRAGFVVLNDDARDVSFDVHVVDWMNDLDGITQFANPGTQTRSCAAWIRLDANSAVLSPSAEFEIVFSVEIPDDVSGTYWAGLLVDASLMDEDAEGTIELWRRFLIRVFVTVPPAVAEGRVTNVKRRGLSPLNVEIGFLNSGNTRLKDVFGLVTVEASSGDVLLELPIVPFDILPGEEVQRTVASDWSLQQEGIYAIRAVLDFGGDVLVAGQSVFRIDALRLSAVGSAVQIPSDPDADGLYEDVDGDGVLSADDVRTLADAIDAASIQHNGRAFDFDNDGEVTPSDVDALREIVLQIGD